MAKKFTLKLIPKEDLETVIPLVYELNNAKVSTTVLMERLLEMKKINYQCLGVYEQQKLVGICGFWILHKFYVGKHIEPDNVFITKGYRSFGIGKLMLDWILDYAKEIGCNSSEINCFVANKRGIKFWEKQGYVAEGYHMRNIFDRNYE